LVFILSLIAVNGSRGLGTVKFRTGRKKKGQGERYN